MFSSKRDPLRPALVTTVGYCCGTSSAVRVERFVERHARYSQRSECRQCDGPMPSVQLARSALKAGRLVNGRAEESNHANSRAT